jgi:HSP20 family protein
LDWRSRCILGSAAIDQWQGTWEKTMAVILPDPFESLFNLQQALDTFRTSSWLQSTSSGGGSYPPVNVFRRDDDFVVIAEIPGIAKSDLDIQVRGSTLRLSGSKNVNYADNASVHRRERLAGQFDRSVSLPVAIEADKVRAEYHDGILALFLPCAESDKPRSIKLA